jgi:hypothetical protein
MFRRQMRQAPRGFKRETIKNLHRLNRSNETKKADKLENKAFLYASTRRKLNQCKSMRASNGQESEA